MGQGPRLLWMGYATMISVKAEGRCPKRADDGLPPTASGSLFDGMSTPRRTDSRGGLYGEFGL